jgi:hypothetical protein
MRESLNATNAETQRVIDLGDEVLTELHRIQARLEGMEKETAAIRDRMKRKANRRP